MTNKIFKPNIIMPVLCYNNMRTCMPTPYLDTFTKINFNYGFYYFSTNIIAYLEYSKESTPLSKIYKLYVYRESISDNRLRDRITPSTRYKSTKYELNNNYYHAYIFRGMCTRKKIYHHINYYSKYIVELLIKIILSSKKIYINNINNIDYNILILNLLRKLYI